MIALDRSSDEPLIRQIYQAIRGEILSGRLSGNTRLPATRVLAADLGVARATVVLAYEQLLAEGFVHGRGAAGTVVSVLTLSQSPAVRRGAVPPASTAMHERAIVSQAPAETRPFRVGEPAVDFFPLRIWARLCARRRRTATTHFLGYGDAGGYEPLRRAIADYTRASRGVRADARQVVLVRGAQQAVDLVARTLVQRGEKVWFEDPGYPAARQIFELAGATIVPIPVDNDGLQVDIACRRAPDARLAYVAPSHQFPLGRTMSIQRRLALLAWAARSQAWIVEDDYDSEFRYPGTPLASLQGLDRADRVIYVGTFSKTVFPALRLGYLILPPELVDRFMSIRSVVDHLAPTVEQAALTDFIEEGHFTRHLRRMRATYRQRQEALLDGARRYLGGVVSVEPADSGMHAIGWLLRPGISDEQVSMRALERGVEAPALSAYCQRVKLRPGLLLGFASLRPEEMAPALRVLASILGA